MERFIRWHRKRRTQKDLDQRIRFMIEDSRKLTEEILNRTDKEAMQSDWEAIGKDWKQIINY